MLNFNTFSAAKLFKIPPIQGGMPLRKPAHDQIREPIRPPRAHVNGNARALAQDKCRDGLAMHRKGMLGQAQSLYEQALQLQPDHFDQTISTRCISWEWFSFNPGSPGRRSPCYKRRLRTTPITRTRKVTWVTHPERHRTPIVYRIAQLSCCSYYVAIRKPLAGQLAKE